MSAAHCPLVVAPALPSDAGAGELPSHCVHCGLILQDDGECVRCGPQEVKRG
jgi:hypothetical protein